MTILSTLARVYVDDLDAALPTFTALTGEQPRLRFAYHELELAGIGAYLLIAGTPEALAPYRETHATTIVDDLGEVLTIITTLGGDILDGPNDVPTGRNLTVRHPGGARIEYVEFDTAKIESIPS
ncbi:VOC family protein [Nocardia tengchongensis]|uniref:VOC family protein n=1 Tax=Nocardia tengchongensis TaxID=2055889 RepID=UPI003690DFA7